MNQRLEIASRILAGFAANPAVFAHNPNCGWSLVNCTDEDLVGYALSLADRLVDTQAAIDAARKALGDDAIMRQHLNEGGTPT